MSARQSFVPRSASRASTHADNEHPFDMPLRNQNSLGQPQRTGSIPNELDSAQPKTDSEKRARFAGMFGKHKLAGKPGSEDHQAAIDASFSSASGRFSGIYCHDMQSLAPPRRSNSPFHGKGSPFVPSSNPDISFVRPTSPMAQCVSHRGDLTISGLKDAHIFTAGVVSGSISTSPMGTIRDGEHDDERTISSNKSSVAESQPARLLERIHEDRCLALAGTNVQVAAHPALRRAKRTIQGAQEDEADFSRPDEIEYMRRVKRVRIDEFSRELSDSHPDDSSHSGVDHTRRQPDLDNTTRQSSPPTNQPGADAAEEISLDGMFANMDTFLNVETFMGLVQKWSTCSREEWLQGSEEIVNQFKDIIDCVKENITANVTLYSRLDDQVRDRHEEQAQLTEHLRRGLGSARTDLIAICQGK
ncbi:hypothetical protein EV702DRAFT_1148543 [Suillus placidus]|uniref:Extracellular mutant protein 11 C-terminal domain-containing protein n=1 Tax=Suillus placidus TaxID=48579 RepID=A0A9P7CVV2_9AGAM|nr:hypothetical protein EV702DRAFT_1148543 [Suillus placidus]